MLLIIFLAVLFTSSIQAVGQPDSANAQRWSKFETEHFSIIFQQGLSELAHQAAAYAESAYGYWMAKYADDADYQLFLILSDINDAAHYGSEVLPQNVVWIDHPFGDALLLERNGAESLLHFLVYQEVGRVLDQIRVEGFMVDLRLFLGKIVLPSLIKPLLYSEGFVAMDRVDPAYTHMVARARSLNDGVPTVAELSAKHTRTEWPKATLQSMAFGALLLNDLRAAQGEELLVEIKRNIASFPLPSLTIGALQISSDRSLRSYFDDFAARFESDLDDALEEQALELRPDRIALGDNHEVLQHPSWSTSGSLLIYQVDDVDRASGLRLVRWDGNDNRFLFACSCTSAHWINQSTLVYTKLSEGNDGVLTSDLFTYNIFGTSEEQVTFDEHVRSVAPLGLGSSRVLLLRDHKGGASDLLAYDTITESREILARFGRSEQPLSIAASRDGSRIAVSHYDGEHGIHLKVLDDFGDVIGHYSIPTAKMLRPQFTFDGQYILFVSNLKARYEVYALRLSDQRVFRVTSSIAGTLEAVPSPDGEFIALVEAGQEGYGLVRIPYQPDNWDRVNDVDLRSIVIAQGEARENVAASDTAELESEYEIDNYDPLDALFPTYRLPFLGPWNFGVYTQNSDPLDLISYQAAVGIGFSPLEFFYDLSFEHSGVMPNILLSINGSPGYHRQNAALRLPVSINSHRARAVEMGINQTPEQTELYALGDIEDVNEYDLLERHSAITTRAAYAWTIAGIAHRIQIDWIETFNFPLLTFKGPHSFAIQASAAWSNLAEYHLGGGLSGDRPLRGHNEVVRGAHRVSLNLSYEFPLLDIETSCCLQHPLPVFFNDVRGSLYLDSGVIGSELNVEDVRMGFGSEIKVRVVLGYGLVEGWFRMGLAYGVANEIPQIYFGFDQDI